MIKKRKKQYYKTKGMKNKQRWFSGRILACHAGGPGSIPGRCKVFLIFVEFLSKISTNKTICYFILKSGFRPNCVELSV